MSIGLIVEVLDHAPDTLTSGERLVLVVIAEWANDRTRIARQSSNWTIDTICRRAGIKRAGLKSILQGLAKKGLEVRVPVKHKDGKPVYAYEGTAVTFQVPTFAQRGGHSIPSESTRGVAVASERGGHSIREGLPQQPPSPQGSPLKKLPSSLSNSDDDVAPATIPAQRTERENEEASQKPKSKKPADRTSLLLGAGLTPDEIKPFTDWCDQLPSGPKGDGWYIRLHGNGTLQERIAEWRTSPAVTSRCDECDDTGETGDWLNRRPCGCLWWKDPATARKHFVAELKNFPDCAHGAAGGDLKAPDGWQHCSMCRGPGWVDRDVQPRTGKRSTGALRAEQGLRVADELDRQFGHGRWAANGLDEYGNGVRPGGGYHHLTDSRAPNRDYHEPL